MCVCVMIIINSRNVKVNDPQPNGFYNTFWCAALSPTPFKKLMGWLFVLFSFEIMNHEPSIHYDRLRKFFLSAVPPFWHITRYMHISIYVRHSFVNLFSITMHAQDFSFLFRKSFRLCSCVCVCVSEVCNFIYYSILFISINHHIYIYCIYFHLCSNQNSCINE